MRCIWLLPLAATSFATIGIANQAITNDICVACGYHDWLLLNLPLLVLLIKRSRLLFVLRFPWVNEYTGPKLPRGHAAAGHGPRCADARARARRGSLPWGAVARLRGTPSPSWQ